MLFFSLQQPTGGSQHAQESEIADLGWFSFQEARPLVTFATDEEVLLAAEAISNQTGLSDNDKRGRPDGAQARRRAASGLLFLRCAGK